MAYNRERIDRQAQVASLTASGATPTEVALALGTTRATVYRDLERIRRRSTDRILLDETDEAAAIEHELAELRSLYARARRDLEERTEPGTPAWAAGVKAVLACKQLILHTCAELGVYRKAVQRHLILPGDELANLDGDELDKYVADLEAAEQRLNRVGSRARSK